MSEVRFKNGKEVSPLREKKKTYWWRYLLAFLGGFVFCIGAIAGGLAITGTVIKAGDIIRMAGGNPEDILALQYQNSSILDLVRAISTTPMETLGDINSITPTIKKTVEETINPVLKENIKFEFDWNELRTKPFVLNTSSPRSEEVYDHTISLGDYIPSAITKGITLEGFVLQEGQSVDDLSNIIKFFLYPYDETSETFDTTHPYTLDQIMNSESNFFQDILDKVRIKDVVDDIDSSPFLAQMAEWKISEFNDESIKGLEIGLLFSDEDKQNNPLLNTIAEHHWTIAQLSDMDNINGLKISEIVDTTSATGLLSAIKDNTLTEIQEPGFIDTILLSDIFTSAEGIMATLADPARGYTVGDLNDEDTILGLTLKEAIGEIDDGNLLKNYENKTLSELKELDVSDILITDVFTPGDNKLIDAFLAKHGNNSTIEDLSDFDKIKVLPLNSIIEDGGNFALQTLLDPARDPITTIENIGTQIDSLTLKEVIDVGTDDTAVIYKLAYSDALINAPLSDLGSAFDSVKVTDIITVDPTDPDTPQILLSMNEQEVTLSELNTFMNGLKVKDAIKIYPGDMYMRTYPGDDYDIYIRENDTWVLISDPTEKAQEVAEYLPATGTKTKNNAVLYTGNTEPGDLYPEAKNRDPLYAARNNSVSDSESLIDSLKTSLRLEDVVIIDENSPEVLKSLSNSKLSDIPDKLKTLTLNQVIGDTSSSSRILQVLGGVTVFGDGDDNLGFALEHLNLIDILGDEIYEDVSDTTKTKNAVKVTYTLKEDDFDIHGDLLDGLGTFKEYLDSVDDYFEALGLASVDVVYDLEIKEAFVDYIFSETPYQESLVNASIQEMYHHVTQETMSSEQIASISEGTYSGEWLSHSMTITGYNAREISGSYWFLFAEYAESFELAYKRYILKKGLTYTINDMGKLTENMLDHVHNDKISDLVEAGFIELPSGMNLNATLKSTIPVHGGRKIGDLTIDDLMEVINSIMYLITD